MLGFSMLQLAVLIFGLPLGAFAVLAVLHHKMPRHGDWLALAAMGGSLCASLAVFAHAWTHKGVLLQVVYPWLPAGTGSALTGGIMIDSLTAVMLVVVTGVSFLVYLFSLGYMHDDIRYGRYYSSLLLFSTSMLGLVLANNLLYLFMFWELVGLSSYLLIGHWYEKKSASDAAIKAFITTRVGDLGMLIGLLICYKQVGSLQNADIFAAVEQGVLSGSLRTWAGLGLFFGAMGKSAQFPLHVWLPDAMEGPTPVSALIHAATMVAAGVYLVGRMFPLFDEPTLTVIACIGGFTAFFAATIALVQDDIKRVLAYSTVSQLGYMILALGVGGWVSGLFHLTTHAFFKAGLFLGSGAVIYAMHHEQSMSRYGGLFRKMPATAMCYLFATLALAGFPGFSGFWSKDAILADALHYSLVHGSWSWLLPGFAFTTVFLTAFYMFRQYLLTFTGKPRDAHAYEHAHEVPWPMLVPLIVLALLSATSGGLGHWFSSFTSSPALVSHEAPLNLQEHALENGLKELAHNGAMLLSTLLAFFGIFTAFLFYWQKKNGETVFNPEAIAARLPFVHRLLWNKYYLDELYSVVFIGPAKFLALAASWFDQGIIDGLVNLAGKIGRLLSETAEKTDRRIVDDGLVLGPARGAAALGAKLSLAQTGYIRQYLLFTGLGLLAATIAVLFL